MRSGGALVAAAVVAVVAGFLATNCNGEDDPAAPAATATEATTAASTLTASAAAPTGSATAVGTPATTATAAATATPTPTPNGPVILSVTRGGKLVKAWSLADLEKAVAFSTVTLDGDDQNGPLLTAVLASSGVTEWTKATAIGFGESRSFEIEVDFAASQVNATWIFDVTNRGTLKLAGENLDRTKWVRDVKELRVE